MAFWQNEEMIEKKDPGRDETEGDSHEIEENLIDNESLSINEEEIDSLDMQLDQLNNALDVLEQRNDDLHAQLVELLEVNKQAREHFLQTRVQNLESDNKKENFKISQLM